jgi:hypothetical protein
MERNSDIVSMNVRKQSFFFQTFFRKTKFLAHIYSKPSSNNKGDVPQNRRAGLNDIERSIIFSIIIDLNSRETDLWKSRQLPAKTTQI